MIKKGDVLKINPKSKLGKTSDLENKNLYLIVDEMPEKGDRYIYCFQTARDQNDDPIPDKRLPQIPLVLDHSNLNKAYTIGELEDGIGDKNAEDNYIKDHPDDFYFK
jgi:hypothetical protein